MSIFIIKINLISTSKGNKNTKNWNINHKFRFD